MGARPKTHQFFRSAVSNASYHYGIFYQQFYGGQLKAAPQVLNETIPLPDVPPLLFIDTAGCGFSETLHPESKSRYNEGEAFILREYFLQLMKKYEKQQLVIPDMAVIAPYSEQARSINAMFQEDETLLLFEEYVKINSVDGFQGQEKEIIFISLTRSNEEGEIGFLKDYRRMNVALTRAKKHLVIIGDSATIGGDPFYEAFLNYVDKHGVYQSAWEYMASGSSMPEL